MKVLAIDQGTTSTRGFVYTTDGARSLVHSHEQQVWHPQPGWVEQDPEELLAAIGQCLARTPDVDALALANQGESCLAWDALDGRPLTRLIVWQDDRTRERTEALRRQGVEALSLERCGLPLDPYFSASKLGWILEQVPEARALHRAGRLRLGTSDAFFLDRLCGRFVTDVTTAARTGLLDLRSGAWDADLCALYGVPLEALPGIVDSVGDFGALPVDGRQLSLSVSLVDQQAALYGHGCRAPGDSKITFGTGAFALTVAGPQPPAAGHGPLPTVAWRKAGEPTVFALEGGVYCASAAVDWARRLGLFDDYRALERFDAPPAVERGLLFVPALSGLACPHWDRQARGLWQGLSLEHGQADLLQSILEGIALRAAEVLAAIEHRVPLAGPVSVDGGLTRSPYFCQFLATVLERPVLVSPDPELTSRGLAMLAFEALGAAPMPALTPRRFMPETGGARYRERFARALSACRSGE
ncbi:FGGY family carbohydrate kinase [Stutzerimonas azotifigens]|uniref:FGGY family carbohydrate kinase n=1 Tax=Stutzerimonas azotifigens TaxID=291995 RepID=UPI00040C2D98|nr:FGGY family carbohydrate kinase [Stutzerimonas azotifigens]